jgi:hypothetical protein
MVRFHPDLVHPSLVAAILKHPLPGLLVFRLTFADTGFEGEVTARASDTPMVQKVLQLLPWLSGVALSLQLTESTPRRSWEKQVNQTLDRAGFETAGYVELVSAGKRKRKRTAPADWFQVTEALCPEEKTEFFRALPLPPDDLDRALYNSNAAGSEADPPDCTAEETRPHPAELDGERVGPNADLGFPLRGFLALKTLRMTHRGGVQQTETAVGHAVVFRWVERTGPFPKEVIFDVRTALDHQGDLRRSPVFQWIKTTWPAEALVEVAIPCRSFQTCDGGQLYSPSTVLHSVGAPDLLVPTIEPHYVRRDGWEKDKALTFLQPHGRVFRNL